MRCIIYVDAHPSNQIVVNPMCPELLRPHFAAMESTSSSKPAGWVESYALDGKIYDVVETERGRGASGMEYKKISIRPAAPAGAVSSAPAAPTTGKQAAAKKEGKSLKPKPAAAQQPTSSAAQQPARTAGKETRELRAARRKEAQAAAALKKKEVAPLHGPQQGARRIIPSDC